MALLKRIKASSLPESIIALTIIVSVFSIMTYLMVSVSASSVSIRHLKARVALEAYAEASKTEEIITNEEIINGDYLLKRELYPYDSAIGLSRVKFSVMDNNKNRLFEFSEIRPLKREQ